MPFVVKQSLIEKTFCKVGQELGENLDLNSSQSAVAFMSGFVDSLRKEAHMDPSHALGFIKYITEIGYNNSVSCKTASVEDGNELDEVFNKMHEKLAGLTLKTAEWSLNPLKWDSVKKFRDEGAEAAGRGAVKEIGDQIGGLATKAWDHLKSPEFLGQVAPYAIGALGGYLIPKLLGGGGNGLVNAGLGAAAVGGGAHLFNKYDLGNPETWRKFKDGAMNFINGGQQKQGMIYQPPGQGGFSPGKGIGTMPLGGGMGQNPLFSPKIDKRTGNPYPMSHPDYASGTKKQRDGIVDLANQQDIPLWDRIRGVFGSGPIQRSPRPQVTLPRFRPEMIHAGIR